MRPTYFSMRFMRGVKKGGEGECERCSVCISERSIGMQKFSSKSDENCAVAVRVLKNYS